MVFTQDMTAALDNENSLWLWGCIPNLTQEGLYEQTGRDSLPKRVLWFRNKNLQVVDIEAGTRAVIVQAQDRQNKTYLYAIPFNAADLDTDEPLNEFYEDGVE